MIGVSGYPTARNQVTRKPEDRQEYAFEATAKGTMGKTVRQGSLETKLGYTFKDPGLLALALSPPSAGLPKDNQRLEFLGDAVLQLCMSQLIFSIHKEWQEGAMSKLRGMLVCTDSLKAWAADLGLELSRGPRTPKRSSPQATGKPLADALEALIAAIFLDSGGNVEAPMEVLARRFEPLVRKAYEGVWAEKDSKTTLQERAASLGMPAPVYELVEKSGPDHAPRFKARVQVGNLSEEAVASTLKAAQAKAARELLPRMMESESRK